MGHLRLRQICLVAPALAPAEGDIAAIFGLEPCYRDPNVAAYGLENTLFAFGTSFLEVVAPTRPGTAAGRFLERFGGRGGYMAIFDCDDPERRAGHAESLGVRVAHRIAHPGYAAVQLHPRDCRAAMIAFDRTEGGEALDGPYHPAGPDWQRESRPERASGPFEIELQGPRPAELAQHWSRLAERPLGRAPDGAPVLAFDLGAARFVPGPEAEPERLSALRLRVRDPAAVLAAAAARGCARHGDGFELCGVVIRPQA